MNSIVGNMKDAMDLRLFLRNYFYPKNQQFIQNNLYSYIQGIDDIDFVSDSYMYRLKCKYKKCSDQDMNGMNIESALVLTQRYNMMDLSSRILLLFGKYYQEIGLIKSPQQTEYLTASGKLYQKASEIVKETKNKYVHKQIEKAKQVLRSFCNINGIKIK